MDVTGRRFLKYTLLPQILPRCQDILRDGFGFIAYSMAWVFWNADLLPAHHPYVNPDNMKKFGVRDVLAQAAHNLKFSFRHTDQILLFGLMLIGCVLTLIQCALMGFTLLIQASHAATAQPTTFADYFLSPLPESDISFIALDRIFGIPGMFGSCVDLNTPCLGSPFSDGGLPMPYHTGLQNLLAFYSQGLLLVGALILVYLALTIVAETSDTGIAFGRRFSRSWAPLRLIAAIGLLIPMGYGLNAAQWITLYIAKYGSGFATNAWNYYVADITAPSTLLGDPALLLSKPDYPTTNDFIQFMAMAQTCWYAYNDLYRYKTDAAGNRVGNIQIAAWAIREGGGPGASMRLDNFLATYTNLYDVQKWFNFGDIIIAFGDYDPVLWPNYKGNVRPFCGEISIPTSRIANGGGGAADGIDQLTYDYLNQIVSTAWYNMGSPYSTYPIAEHVVKHVIYNDMTPANALPTPQDLSALITNYNNLLKQLIDQAYLTMTTAPVTTTFWANDAMMYGWAGAGIWYNKIAQMNGLFSETVFDIPMVMHYPEISEDIQQERQKSSPNVPGETRFDPNIPPARDGKKNNIKFSTDDQKIAMAMNQTYVLFNKLQEDVIKPSTGNDFYDAINALFKKTGLWSLRDNNNIHPLAQLAALGKALLSNTIVAFGSGTAAGLISILGQQSALASVAKTVSSFLLSITFIGLASGILLYYVVPLMPFIYFFFAVVGWAKTIFEAMIGLPLWALAHLRFDGRDSQGFPTPQSMFGYFLLVDIFIRPILIVFGLIASTTIFYAVAKTFNNIFDIVVSNLTGFDTTNIATIPAIDTGSLTYERGPLDQLAFTLIYAVVLYMIGNGCFKMIDMFPNKILRWMGSNAVGFGSMHRHDVVERLSQGLKSGTMQVGGMFGQGVGRMTGVGVHDPNDPTHAPPP